MNNTYRLSFTGASFFLHETIILANLCLEYDDCAKALNHLLSSEILDRSKSTVKRESSEIILRLNNLPNTLLERLASIDPDDAKVILLYAIMKTYPIIKEFCLEILYEKSLIMDNTLQEYEINAFWRRKEEEQEVLHEKSDATKKKLKQVMFKILADAGILSSTKEKAIVKPYINDVTAKMILEDSDESYLRALLMNDSEIVMVGA
jgi:hypothetical protein